jgi:hypothetical protein
VLGSLGVGYWGWSLEDIFWECISQNFFFGGLIGIGWVGHIALNLGGAGACCSRRWGIRAAFLLCPPQSFIYPPPHLSFLLAPSFTHPNITVTAAQHHPSSSSFQTVTRPHPSLLFPYHPPFKNCTNPPSTVIVYENRRSGFLGEHSCMDGTPTLRMNEFMLATLGANKVDLGPSPQGEPSLSPFFRFFGLSMWFGIN